MAAMGVSTQRNPFKPCCPSPLWFSQPSLRSPSITASSSSHPFSTSPKALQRRDLHLLRGANRPCFKITVLRSSFQLKRGSSHSTRPFTTEDATCMIGRRQPYSLPRFGPRLVVLMEQNNPSKSSARMFPDYIDKRKRFFDYPSAMLSEGKLVSEGSVNLQMVDEERKETHRCFQEQLERDLVDVPLSRPSDYRSPTGSFPGIEESKNLWLAETQKLKEKMMVNHGTSERLPVGSDHDMDLHANFSRGSRLDNIVVEEALQSSSGKKNLGSDLGTRKACTPILETNSSGASHFTSRGHASHVTVNEPRLRSHNSIAEINRSNTKPDQLMQAGPYLTQMARNDVQSNESLAGKLREISKQKFSELPGDRPNNATESGSSNGKSKAISNELNEIHVEPTKDGEECAILTAECREKLSRIYDKVLVVDSVSAAKKIVEVLTTKYRHLVHACDTEVSKIDVRQETPVDHGELICFSIYSGEGVDFGNGNSCIWVDVLDGGGRDLLMEFAPFFEDPSIKKVWHNYSFDSHIIENYGLKISGFHADTMHMARLWDSSRRIEGGYSLEALTSDPRVMSGSKKQKEVSGTNQEKKEIVSTGGDLIGKISMKTIFGKRKLKKDGSEGKLITIAPVEELQREERINWICYSCLDSMSTLKLFESLKDKLMGMPWILDGCKRGSMYDFYEEYWRPFGELLVKMETEGMLVDRSYLADVEKVAIVEQQIAGNRFRNWASQKCPDALFMNIGSDTQLRQLFFGGIVNRKNPNESLDLEKTFKVPNVDKVIEEGKKVPTKFRKITLKKIGEEMETEIFTSSGWPSVSGDVLKVLAGKVSSEYDWSGDDFDPTVSEKDIDTSSYGTAYAAFGEGKEGREACHAIAALCEVCSIDSLISNFILPLQSSVISGKDGRVHCSLNINTETGRLSARRPNLQNQPALEKDRYKIRQAFVAAPGNSLIVADYGQLELRILAHLANCTSMLDAFKAGGDFHSRTAMNMYPHIREAVDKKQVLLEWHPQPGEEKPPVPLLKDAFASERRKAKMLNFSIAYGKTPVGLSRDWKVSVKEAKKTVDLWYKQRQEVLSWQEERKKEAYKNRCVHTLLGRARCFPSMASASNAQKGHIERAAINTPVQGSAADVAMCAMLEISRNSRLKELGWRLLLQVHDEVILEGPTESAEEAKAIVVECMSKPFYGTNFLKVDLSVDAKCAQNWYAAK
ncbi:DNA-directed DNA polymerase [Macleaya cordata]|uniref:DNA-directed DNA polymerase n=1 Tax=Macleaya cordata TaxID=56857 RepID=A0A200QLZ0_MACCD|nr:DNA-directed DNA polymerase [Macleaya cordata]